MELASLNKKTSMALASIGAVLAAIVGAIIWTVIVVVSDREIGYMAIGMGALVAASVLLLTGGKKGLGFQIIAIIFSVIGIALGKYLIIFYLTKEFVMQEYGIALTFFDIFSLEFLGILRDTIGEFVNGYDVLWVALAVYTAYTMLDPKELTLKKEASN